MSARLLWWPIIIFGGILLIGGALWYRIEKQALEETPIPVFTEAERMDILDRLRMSSEVSQPVPKDEKIETLGELRAASAPRSDASGTSGAGGTEDKLKTLQMLHDSR